MPWPQATDYNSAVQTPAVSFCDPDLRQGRTVGDFLGLPRPHSGNFADVYQILGPDNQSWAVKCFTREVHDLHLRYQAVSEHLRHERRAFMVDFHYLGEGVRVRGQWYPVLKMRWIAGQRLNEFVSNHLEAPGLLEQMTRKWLKLARELREAGMAHGDLQHGNVLFVPGSKSNSLALRLIDYDGMYVPSLAPFPSGEVGHPNYQHPERLRTGGYGPEMDRFSHLVIYHALRCLTVGRRRLWERYDNGENLLFREDDFRRPRESRLFHELWSLNDPDVRALTGHLLLASQNPLAEVPLLDDLLDGESIRPLTGAEVGEVTSLLLQGERPRKSRLVVIPALPSPLLPSEPAGPAAPAIPLSAPPRQPVPEVVPPARESVSVEHDTVSTAVPLETAVTMPVLPAEKPAPPLRRSPSSSRRGTRPFWLGLAILAVALAVPLAVWAVWSHRPTDKHNTPLLPRLPTIPAVVMNGGEKRDLEIVVILNGCLKPLGVLVEGLPEGVTYQPVPLAADEVVARVQLSAAPNAEVEPSEVRMTLWMDGEKIDEQPFDLTVRKIPLPRLHVVPSLALLPGQRTGLDVPVDRRGYPGVLTVRAEDLPEGVTQSSLTQNPPPLIPRLEIEADAGVKPGVYTMTLCLLADVYEVDRQRPVQLEVRKPPRPRVLGPRGGPTVTAGTSQELRVFVDRQGYTGVIELRPESVPDRVTCRAAKLAGDQAAAALEVKADADAPVGAAQITVAGYVDDEKIGECTATITIVKKPVVVVDVRKPDPPPRPEAVRFTTVDQVELHGTFYPSPEGRKGPCVLLLHNVARGSNGNHHEGGLDNLALALQKKGCAVLGFDFRGHGKSTQIGADFWNARNHHNAQLRNAKNPKVPPPNALDAKKFPAAYYRHLVNDVAAARLFLEEQHDQGKCNATSLILIGEGDGATVGAIWLALECDRYVADAKGNRAAEWPPEAANVAGAIWLNPTATLGGTQQLSWGAWLTEAGRQHKVPTAFVYEEDDKVASQAALHGMQALLPGYKRDNPPDDAAAREYPYAATKKSDLALVPKSDPAEEIVLNCVEGLRERHPPLEWARLNSESKAYCWVFKGVTIAGKSDKDKSPHPQPVERMGLR
jgi:pimeloyl-ACP methyl ester carboxylesterase